MRSSSVAVGSRVRAARASGRVSCCSRRRSTARARSSWSRRCRASASSSTPAKAVSTWESTSTTPLRKSTACCKSSTRADDGGGRGDGRPVTMRTLRALLSWSSGKDSAWSLHILRQQGEYEVAGLLTTVNESAGRVAMHAVREELLEAQAAAAGLPLWRVPIPSPCSNEQYEVAMHQALDRARAAHIDAVAFGDLFLEDVRRYREERMADSGLRLLFPLWQRPTPALAREMIAGGVRAVLTCVDPKQLAPTFAGREFNLDLLRDLPPAVDPCGENGEFHSFVFAGPMFQEDVRVAVGAIVERDGFVFA